jgi:hypothetical protein
MTKQILLTEEEFDRQYTIRPNHLTKEDRSFGGMYETYGEELQYILSMANSSNKNDQNRVWTIVDDGDNMSITTGYHLVNRLGYLITEQPAPEDTIIDVVIDIEMDN